MLGPAPGVAGTLRLRPGIVIEIPFELFCFFAGIIMLVPSPLERLRFPLSFEDIRGQNS